MASTSSRTPSLTPSRSNTPEPPVQPDHFYGNENPHLPHSPNSVGRTWLDPADDPLAQRGIPVFKPTMEEFQDFEGYMNKVECWGSRSGIVKVIPPAEWRDALPSLRPQLSDVKLRNPIEQQMMGHAGLYRQQNIEKRKIMSVREWAEFCARPELRAPGIDEVGHRARATRSGAAARQTRGSTRRKTRDAETAEPNVIVKEEEDEVVGVDINLVIEAESLDAGKAVATPPTNADASLTPTPDRAAASQTPPPTTAPVRSTPPAEDQDHTAKEQNKSVADKGKPKTKRRNPHNKEAREAALAARARKDEAFLDNFEPHTAWLPPNTSASDYTPEFCKELERTYWRGCAIGTPAWYGADMQGSLFTDDTTAWNVAHLPSALSRLLAASGKQLPGVNTPYLYFGMWRATFAWHVEDMDLFSINYIHFGAPKFWYAVPQGMAGRLEMTMKAHFPGDTSNCSQFLRHKSFLASPGRLAESSCRPNTLVQHEGEFVITYPRGYHAGFNLGFNCAESVNFALDSWIALGRVAKACECVDYSVRIDVDDLLRCAAERAQEEEAEPEEHEQKPAKAKSPRKRKAPDIEGAPAPKKSRTRPVKKESEILMLAPSPPPSRPITIAPKVTLKLGPQPKEPDVFPCCLCVSMSRESLLRVQDPPVWRLEGQSGDAPSANAEWMAHEECANVVPETWIDEVEVGPVLSDGERAKERMVLGVDGIVNDRWNLKCNACTKTRHRSHGAPIQCTKGRCPKAFHVSCARDGAALNIIYRRVRETEKEVVLLDPANHPHMSPSTPENIPMDIDPQLVQPPPQVLKLIRKLEVELLCPQHNPDVAEAKKAAKQDKIRNELLALPPMARIKLRVSAGVFEVSLVRVVEESNSVEVLWDRGLKREFKWGSVVFGNTKGVLVGQKPSEAAPEPDSSAAPVPTMTFATQRPLAPAPTSGYGAQAYGRQPVASTSYAPSPPYPQAYQGNYFPSYQPYQPPAPGSTAQQAPRTWSSYPYSTSHPAPRYTAGLIQNAQSSAYAAPPPPAPAYAPPPQGQPYPPPEQSIPGTPNSHPQTDSSNAVQQPGPQTSERPSYTSMSYQGYAGYGSAPAPSYSGAYPPPGYAAPPAQSPAPPPPSSPSPPSATSPTNTAPPPPTAQIPRPYFAPPVPTYAAPPVSASPTQPPAATTLRWQQPYTGPKVQHDPPAPQPVST